MTQQDDITQRVQDPLFEAIDILTVAADELRHAHTLGDSFDDWTGEPEAKTEYDRILRVVAALSKLRAPVSSIREGFELTYAADADDPACATDLFHFTNGWRACLMSQVRAPVADERASELDAECNSLAHQLNASNERNGVLRAALSDCSAELFAQCGDQSRAMSYVNAARAALASAPVAKPNRAPVDDGICWSSKEIQRRQKEEDDARAAYYHSRASAPVADERAAFESWATAIAEKYDVTRNGDHYMEPYTEWVWEAWQARAALASAPVAGEAQPSDADITNTIRALDDQARYTRDVDGEMGVRVKDVMIARAVLARYGHTPLPMADAAPQASAEPQQYTHAEVFGPMESAWNSALDQAAAVAKRISDKYAFGHYGNETDTADEIEREILALKQPQADKDSSQQRAGDGKEPR